MSKLLTIGSHVQAVIATGEPVRTITGTLVEHDSEPAPHLLIELDHGRGPVAVFLGPGVIVQYAPPAHPGMD